MTDSLPEPMRIALDEARAAALAQEVPVGAVVTRDGAIVARARNRMRGGSDPTAHAEMVALRDAGQKLGTSRLDGCEMWVTLEPCAMCTAAIGLARIRRLHLGALDPKGGAVFHGPRLYEQPTCHHRPDIVGPLAEQESGEMLRSFFRARR